MMNVKAKHLLSKWRPTHLGQQEPLNSTLKQRFGRLHYPDSCPDELHVQLQFSGGT